MKIELDLETRDFVLIMHSWQRMTKANWANLLLILGGLTAVLCYYWKRIKRYKVEKSKRCTVNLIFRKSKVIVLKVCPWTIF